MPSSETIWLLPGRDQIGMMAGIRLEQATGIIGIRTTISTFSIFPIDSVDKVVELETCDPSLALMRIDEDRLGEADVFENGVYSFSCQPLYQDA